MEPEIDRSIEGKVWFDMLSISIDEFECANQSTRRMGRPVGRRLREQLGGWPGMDGTRMVCWPQITTPPNHQSFPFQFDRSDHPFYAFDRSTEQPPNPKAKARPSRRQPNRNSNAALGICLLRPSPSRRRVRPWRAHTRLPFTLRAPSGHCSIARINSTRNPSAARPFALIDAMRGGLLAVRSLSWCRAAFPLPSPRLPLARLTSKHARRSATRITRRSSLQAPQPPKILTE